VFPQSFELFFIFNFFYHFNILTLKINLKKYYFNITSSKIYYIFISSKLFRGRLVTWLRVRFTRSSHTKSRLIKKKNYFLMVEPIKMSAEPHVYEKQHFAASRREKKAE